MAEEVAGGLQLQPPRVQALHPSNLIPTPSTSQRVESLHTHCTLVYNVMDNEYNDLYSSARYQ